MIKKGNQGFTLIELLVVIAIIGVLSSVITASLGTARGKARDAQRISDLQQIEKAIAIYTNDTNRFPREGADSANGIIGEGAGLDTIIANYIESVPADPRGPGNSNYYYFYDGNAICGGYPDGGAVAVIFARFMEQTSGNGSALCTSQSGEGGFNQPETWSIILGGSSG